MSDEKARTVETLAVGEYATIVAVAGEETFRQRLLEMGLSPGVRVRRGISAPLGDPIELEARGFRVMLRRVDAAAIQVVPATRSTAEVQTLTPSANADTDTDTRDGAAASAGTDADAADDDGRTETDAESDANTDTVAGAGASPRRALRVALAGNPNTGKSTLFSRLTGARARVGNYPGTTVDVARADCTFADGVTAELVDIPGSYSLNTRSREEQIAIDALLGRGAAAAPPDAVIVLLNATALERSLYLLLQVQELALPTIAVVNMLDEAEEAGIRIDIDALAEHFGLPCCGVVAREGRGVDELRKLVAELLRRPAPDPQPWHWRPPSWLDGPLDALAPAAATAIASGPSADAKGDAQAPIPNARRRAFALWALMSARDGEDTLDLPEALRRRVADTRAALRDAGHDVDLEVTRARYRHIDEDARRFISRPDEPHGGDPVGGEAGARPQHDSPDERPLWRSRTQRIDAVLTHPISGLLIFLSLMALVFTAMFDWVAPLMDGIDNGFSALSDAATKALPGGFFANLLTRGVIKGVGAVLVFLPQILLLLALLALMEGSGYMARAAFMMDRLMRAIGLSGKAFVPMISGYACAIPAILATRTLPTRRDRLLTMAVIPLMSCSARLPVYSLVVAAMLPAERKILGPLSLGTVTMMAIYLVSTALALVVAGVIGRTVLKGKRPPLLLELPPYRLPVARSVLLALWQKTKAFLKTAGTVILVVSCVLWALLAYPKNVELSRDYAKAIAAAKKRGDKKTAEALVNARQAERTAKSYAGRLGHAIEPAIRPLGFDWRIGVGLIGAFAAREVFVSTLGLVYGAGEADEDSATLRQALRRNPRYTPLVALSLIVFFMIAMQCVSTLAIIRQESGGWRFPIFMLIYLSVLAYGLSLLTYQVGRLLGFG